MFKLLDRYIGGEVTLYSAGFYGAFLVFMVANYLFILLQQVQDRQVPGMVVVRLLLLHTPADMTWGLPASILFGVLVAVGRMANDSEINAMKTSGISLARIQWSVLAIGLAASLGVWWVGEKVAPPTLKEWARLSFAYGLGSMPERTQSQRFLKGSGSDQYFYFQSVDLERHIVNGVFMIEPAAGGGRPARTIMARTGDVQGEKIVLHGGVQVAFDAKGYPEKSSPFDTLEVEVGGNVIQDIKPPEQPQLMGIEELQREIPLREEGGETEKQLAPYRTEKYFKYSLPLAALVFAFLAFPLAARSARGGRFMSLFMALLLYGLYYVLISGSKILGYNGAIPPMLAGWLTTGTMIVISAFLLLWGER